MEIIVFLHEKRQKFENLMKELFHIKGRRNEMDEDPGCLLKRFKLPFCLCV